MALNAREFVESPKEIGVDEVIPFTATFPTTWGTVTSPTVVVKNPDGGVVSGAVSGTPTVTTNVVSFTIDAPTGGLISGKTYRFEVKGSVTGGTVEAWGRLEVTE